MQQLTSLLVALRRFISRFTNRLKLFVTTLKGEKLTSLNEEFNQAFTSIKQYLTKLSVLASLEVGDTLYLYLAVSDVLVSAALIKEDENWKQRPIFFVRNSLFEAETRYACLEQTALALRVAAKKLRPYFQTHPIVVSTNLPLRSTIPKPDLLGRMAQ